jgi:D-3-phosphoglycerate dehydrogenase
MQRLRVLCPEPQNYSKAGLETMASLTELDAHPLLQEAFEQRSPNYDVLMVRLQTMVTGDIIKECPCLKVIISPTTGLDHIDLEAVNEHEIQLFSLKGEAEFLCTVTSSAEHTFALLLSLIRRIPSAFAAVKRSEWNQDQFRGHELLGKTLGIVGYGRVGALMARYGNAFGMHVLAYDPYVDKYADYVTRVVTLDELLQTSEVLSVHVPLEKATIALIGLREIGLLPSGAFLINTSRGEIVDEVALLAALQGGRIAGAAVDVLTDEHRIRIVGHPLIEYAKEHDNLIITPHIGGAAWEAIEKTDMFVIGKFRKWMEGQNLKGVT